ncbi:MAG TPA: acyl-CoA dehydrogenase family protein [Mycobacterium sp.]
MNLDETDEERMVAESVRRVLEHREDDTEKETWGRDWDRDSYRHLGELGILELLAVSKDSDDGGATAAVAAGVAAELGRQGVVSPAMSSVGWVASLLSQLDPAHPALPGLLSGSVVGVFAPIENGSAGAGLFAPTVVAGCAGSTLEVRGRKAFVPFIADADFVVVTARKDGELALVAAPAASLRESARAMSVTTGDLLSVIELDLLLDDAALIATGATAVAALERVWARVLLLQAAYLHGGAARLIELTTCHVTMREQFGQPVGSFQAVQHHIADADVAVRSARLLVAEQAWREDNVDPHLLARAAETKAWIAERTAEVARRAHELQGGISVVDNHETARLFMRNLSVGVEDGAPPELWQRAAALRDVPPTIEYARRERER